MSDVLVCILTGGVAAAGIKLIESVIVWRLNRKAKEEDDNTQKEVEKKKHDEAAHHEDGGCGRARHGRPPKNLSVCFPDARMVVFRYTFCVFLAK